MIKRRRQKIGGYAWNQQMKRAHDANARARASLQEIHAHITSATHISPLLISHLTAQAALALLENAEALRELHEIAQAQKGD